jgi:hypothetical protein
MCPGFVVFDRPRGLVFSHVLKKKKEGEKEDTWMPESPPPIHVFRHETTIHVQEFFRRMQKAMCDYGVDTMISIVESGRGRGGKAAAAAIVTEETHVLASDPQQEQEQSTVVEKKKEQQ